MHSFKPSLTFAAASMLILLLFSNPAAADPFIEIYLDQMNQVASALESVTDPASATVAAGKIQTAALILKDMSRSMEGADKDKQMQLMMATNQERFMQTQMRMQMAMARLGMANPELMGILGEAMADLNKSSR